MVAFMHERKSLTIMGPPLWDTKCIFSITSSKIDKNYYSFTMLVVSMHITH